MRSDRANEKGTQPLLFLAGVVAPIETTEAEIARFMRVIETRCLNDRCEIHLAGSRQFIAGVMAPSDMGGDRVISLRQFLSDLSACAGFAIHLGESTVPATTVVNCESKVAGFSMTVRLAGSFLRVRSLINDLEPNGYWEGDDITPRFRSYHGAVATYHSATQSLQFQGKPAIAMALRNRFLARIGRAH
jgi:hypothetical protein